MRLALLLPGLLLASTLLGPATAPGEEGTAGWSLDPLVRVVPHRLGLSFPVAIQMLDDGRVFYGEWQSGRVNILHPDGAITGFVDLDVLTGGEMGLHEVSYREVDGTPYVYVSYTYGKDSYWGCVLCRDHLSRFEEVAPGVAGPEEVLLDLQGGFVHNGGIIAWGPQDGKLYYSRGDASFDAQSQVVNGDKGRIMRLEPDGAIPPDNPLGADNPTYAYGLRHTFGLDFLPGTQLLVGTENGPERNDEINLLLPGANYGWPLVTGYEGLTSRSGFVPPLRAFPITVGVTNGHFYTGTAIPHWTGSYFFGDTNTGRIYRLTPTLDLLGQGEPYVEVVADTPFLVVDLQTGPDGLLYFTRADGIYRFEPVLAPGLGI